VRGLPWPAVATTCRRNLAIPPLIVGRGDALCCEQSCLADAWPASLFSLLMSHHQCRYRNKISFALSPPTATLDGRGNVTQLGLNELRSDAIVHLQSCHLASKTAEAVLHKLNAVLLNLPGAGVRFDAETEAGFVKAVTLLEGTASADQTPAEQPGPAILVDVQTARLGSQKQQALLMALVRALQQVPAVCGIVQSVHARQSLHAPAEQVISVSGQDHVCLHVGHLVLRRHVEAFAQVNTVQTAVLYQALEDMAQLQPGDAVLDLYTGMGSIALWLARRCRKVVGVDIVEAAIDTARENARLNDIGNASFVATNLSGDTAGAVLARKDIEGAAVVVVDPARQGLSKEVIKFLGGHGARAIVYVSCNSLTMCRDLQELSAYRWRCTGVVGVDMFPQTDHLECVVRLER
jgi:23S rRNA (uracil1939-C5)-methyltransferase